METDHLIMEDDWPATAKSKMNLEVHGEE